MFTNFITFFLKVTMSSRNSALATLTAQYTDSENEDDNKVYSNNEESQVLLT